jgi:subtilisin family serine protease
MTKLDAELTRQVVLFKAKPSAGDASRVLRVLLKFSGDLNAIKEKGFTVQSVIGDVAIGLIELTKLEQLSALESVIYIEAERFHTLHLKDSVPSINAPEVWTGTPSITGKGVIVGVIDTGIDIFHKSFIDSLGKTRILFLWDQSLTPQGSEKSPTGFSGGVEFTDKDINAALATPDKPFRSFDVAKHGTHVAGTAAGNGSQSGNCHLSNTYVGVAPEVSLIIVKSQPDPYEYAIIPAAAPYTVTLRNAGAWVANIWVAYLNSFTGFRLVTANPKESEFTVSAGVYTFNSADAGKAILISYADNASAPHVSNAGYLEGARYIFQRAQTAGAGGTLMPCVINMSFGGNNGAHDGTSLEETTVDTLATASAGRAIVVAAGNDGGKEKEPVHTGPGNGLHAAGLIAANGHQTLTFIVPPNDYTADKLHLWYSGSGRLSVTLTSPNGANVTQPAGSAVPLAAMGLDVATIASTVNNALNHKHNIEVTITPPNPLPPTPPATTALRFSITQGPWTLLLQETAGAQVDFFDCWIDRQLDDPGAFFAPDDEDSTRTINIPGTAKNVITVGAYKVEDSSLANFSSRGPVLRIDTSSTLKPDITAPGVGIIAPKAGQRSESCCCDCCVNFYRPDEGTSMAAPHVTGVVALMFQKDPMATSDVIKSHVQSTARIPDPIPDTPLPNNDWGFGQIDAFEAVHAIGINALARSGGGGGSGPTGITWDDSRGQEKRNRETLPLAAMWSTYLPNAQRLRGLSAILHRDPTGQLLAALVSDHFDEVFRLVNTNRRLAACWHRMHGPFLLRELARCVEEDDAPLLPALVLGKSLSERLRPALALLNRYGSAALRADIVRHGALVLALPGVAARNLRSLSGPPDSGPTNLGLANEEDSCLLLQS